MNPIDALPRQGDWEVGLVSMPEVRVQGVVLEGMLFVVQRADGIVRFATAVPAGGALDEALLVAALEPLAPSLPARPMTLWCTTALRPRISAAAVQLRAEVRTAVALPGVDEVARTFADHLVSGPTFVPHQPARWRSLVREAVRAAPWRTLPDDVTFVYAEGPEGLRGAVGVVLGIAGEQHGLVVFPTLEDHRRFVDHADLEHARADVRAWCVHLDPVDALSSTYARRLKKLGLVHGGMALVLFGMFPDGPRPLDRQEERACHAALSGVLAAWAQHGDELLLEPCVATTRDGIIVLATPPHITLARARNRILDAEHLAMLTEPDDHHHLGLVLKMAKRHAVSLAGALDGVDALSVDDMLDGLDILAWRGGACLGVLTHVPHGLPGWERWPTRGEARLLICAGGAKRRTVRPSDVVRVLPVTCPGHAPLQDLG